MNSTDKSSTADEDTTSTVNGAASPAPSSSSDTKRSAVRQLIELYFYQLQRGCGNPICTNENCASSGLVPEMSANDIAAKALQLIKQNAKLCDTNSQATKMPRNEFETPRHSGFDADAEMEEDVLETTNTSNGANGLVEATDSKGPTIPSSPLAPSRSENQKSLSPIKEHQSPCDTPILAHFTYLDESIIDQLLVDVELNDDEEVLVEALNTVFSSVATMRHSFCRKATLPSFAPKQSVEPNPSTSGGLAKFQYLKKKPPKGLKKEDLRQLESENEKEEDCKAAAEATSATSARRIYEADDPMESEMSELERLVLMNTFTGGRRRSYYENIGINVDVEVDEKQGMSSVSDATALVNVDFASLRRVKKKLYALKSECIEDAVSDSVIQMATDIIDNYKKIDDWEAIFHCLVIGFDMAANTTNSFADMEFLEHSLPYLCQAACILPIKWQARFARIWATNSKDQLQSLIQWCQQLIALKVIGTDSVLVVQCNSEVVAVTKVLKIIFCANILAGQTEKRQLTDDTGDSISSQAAYDDGDSSNFPNDKLEKELNISNIHCRVPLVPFDEFYNQPLSDSVHMEHDYFAYRKIMMEPTKEDLPFSFMLYSFILTPPTKLVALYYDNRIRMHNVSLQQNNLGVGGDMEGNLNLKVRREHIISDALIELEVIANNNPKDLKKQLVVEFIGEQGIDEGGLSKEFFQLVIEEVFNPDFGMFLQQPETNTAWFNPSPYENEAQFQLIGIVIGLAIYNNNVILPVNFPKVVYRKLMNSPGTIYDLMDWSPTLYNSLTSMLNYEGSDFEDVFMQTFRISYANMFGEMVEHDLKPNGENIKVTLENRQEFVDMYTDHMLNRSIQRQFDAFKKGFEMVTDESPLKLLFRPDEIELIVCGSQNFDFEELEQSTSYDGGFSKTHSLIEHFWSIVHSMSTESKRKFLEFTTGSDRVPVGGLSHLKLMITRQGADSDRLPTSHTCFNVLLLPEYSSKAKLKDRLMKAINYSKGFGLL